ncbi:MULTISPECIES: hypothetical protein [Brucella/Ochrobactrum group]|jgi:hypothetical protein|uniref:hypothetical protein n=1 Tax=Brucella/Ochrobactrum group TaxID=2826938 RepID=UPI0018AAF34B|nr:MULTISPECIES: hypothetical protein [Brucella/Ochrobactrum group]MCH4538719.1 hypothetical protein [Ochrobactrum sp. A-1]
MNRIKVTKGLLASIAIALTMAMAVSPTVAQQIIAGGDLNPAYPGGSPWNVGSDLAIGNTSYGRLLSRAEGRLCAAADDGGYRFQYVESAGSGYWLSAKNHRCGQRLRSTGGRCGRLCNVRGVVAARIREFRYPGRFSSPSPSNQSRVFIAIAERAIAVSDVSCRLGASSS